MSLRCSAKTCTQYQISLSQPISRGEYTKRSSLWQILSNKLQFIDGAWLVGRWRDTSDWRLLLRKFIAIESVYFLRQRRSARLRVRWRTASRGTLRNACTSLYRFSSGYCRSLIRDTNQITLRETQRIKSAKSSHIFDRHLAWTLADLLAHVSITRNAIVKYEARRWRQSTSPQNYNLI